MKILVILCSLVYVSNCMKENTDNLNDVLRDPNLWSLIEKRFGLADGDRQEEPHPRRNQQPAEQVDTSDRNDFRSSHPQDNRDEESERKDPIGNVNAMEDSLGNLCQYKPNSSLIIRSKASLAAGAYFLKTFSAIQQEECVDYCCYTQGCNMAIYENKDEHNCYLFNCGVPNKCLFAVHANYTTMMFPNHVPPAESVSEHQKKHEDELEGLGVKTTTKATTTTPVPTTRKPVALYGSCDIDWGDRCADPNAECRDEQCKCEKGYHAKYGICRKVCEESKFECENKGQMGSVPECIDKEHVCDGTPQCADGSDEEQCKPATSAPTTSKVPAPPVIPAAGQGHLSQTLNNPGYGIPQTSNNGPAGQPYILNPNPVKSMYGSPSGQGLYNQLQGYNQPLLPGGTDSLSPNGAFQNYYWPQDNNWQSHYGQQGFGGYNVNPYDRYRSQFGLYGNKMPDSYDIDSAMSKPVMQSGSLNLLNGGQGKMYGKIVPNSKTHRPLDVKTNSPTSSTASSTTTPVPTSTPKATTKTPTESVKNNRWRLQDGGVGDDLYQEEIETQRSRNRNSQGKVETEPTRYGNSHGGTQHLRNRHRQEPFSLDKDESGRKQQQGQEYQDSQQQSPEYQVPQQQSPEYQDSQQQRPEYQVPKQQSPEYQVPQQKSPQYQDSQQSGYNLAEDKVRQPKKHRQHGVNPQDQRRKPNKSSFPYYEDVGYDHRYPYNWGDYDYYYHDNQDFPSNQRHQGKGRMDYGTFRHGGKEKTFKSDNQNPYGRFKGKDDSGDTQSWLGHKDKVWRPPVSTPVPAPERPVIHHVDNLPKLPSQKPQISSNTSDVTSRISKQKVENVQKSTTTTTTAQHARTTAAPKKANVTAEKTKIQKGDNSSTSLHSKKPVSAEDPGLEKVKVLSPTDSNQGPIVALALGLGITLMLLVFVGCRLRTVKRRIRKGRALHSNEADYLINGMYL